MGTRFAPAWLLMLLLTILHFHSFCFHDLGKCSCTALASLRKTFHCRKTGNWWPAFVSSSTVLAFWLSTYFVGKRGIGSWCACSNQGRTPLVGVPSCDAPHRTGHSSVCSALRSGASSAYAAASYQQPWLCELRSPSWSGFSLPVFLFLLCYSTSPLLLSVWLSLRGPNWCILL